MAQKQYDFIAGTEEGIYMADGGKRSDTFTRRGEGGRGVEGSELELEFSEAGNSIYNRGETKLRIDLGNERTSSEARFAKEKKKIFVRADASRRRVSLAYAHVQKWVLGNGTYEVGIPWNRYTGPAIFDNNFHLVPPRDIRDPSHGSDVPLPLPPSSKFSFQYIPPGRDASRFFLASSSFDAFLFLLRFVDRSRSFENFQLPFSRLKRNFQIGIDRNCGLDIRIGATKVWDIERILINFASQSGLIGECEKR